MRTLYTLLSLGFLGLTLIPSLLVFLGYLTLENNKLLMLIGTLGWFITAPLWINKQDKAPGAGTD